MAEAFNDVTFPDEYPRSDVAVHEVLMAFRNDSDAIAFREWWFDKGATLFGRWLAKKNGE